MYKNVKHNVPSLLPTKIINITIIIIQITLNVNDLKNEFHCR